MNHSSAIKLTVLSHLGSSEMSDDEYVEAAQSLFTYDVSDISDKINNHVEAVVGKDVKEEIEELLASERYQKYIDATLEAGKLVTPDVDLIVKFFSGDKGVVN